SSPAHAVVALNDGIADGRDVSWIWDVDFEPLISGLERLVATGDRAAELALRFKYGGLDPDSIEVVSSLERALDRGLELTPAGGPASTICSTWAADRTESRLSSRAISQPRRTGCAARSRVAPRCSPSAAATSCSVARTVTFRASTCPGSTCSRSRRWRASEG